MRKPGGLLKDKLRLLVKNPFRFRKHKSYRGVFKVKVSIESRSSRLMYAVFMPDNNSITVLGIFPRSAGYKDFERIFGHLRS